MRFSPFCRLAPLLLLILCGCSQISGYSTLPAEYPRIHEQTFHRPFSEVWNAAITALTGSGCTIEQVDKASGVLVASFTSEAPEKLIDCGKVIEYGTLQGTDYRMEYSGTATPITKKYVPGTNTVTALDALRVMHVSGRINLVLRPQGTTTSAAVTTSYTVSLSYYLEIPAGPQEPQISHKTELVENTMHFSNGETGSFGGFGDLHCRAKGTLERGLLHGMDKALATPGTVPARK